LLLRVVLMGCCAATSVSRETEQVRDPKKVHLEFRPLAGEEELDAWLDLCATCFAPRCRGYFADHYKTDPSKDSSLVFVAVDAGQIVGSIRVFSRMMNVLGHGPIPMGGIGEVCTRESHRGKGVQSGLMKMAIEAMEKRNFSISLLFAAPAAIGMYNKFGFNAVPQVRVCETWKKTALDAAVKDWPHEVQSIPDERLRKDGVPNLMSSLHAKTMESLTGPVVRTQEYWSSWVGQSEEALPEMLAVTSAAADGSARAYLLICAPEKYLVPESSKAEKHSLRLKVLDFCCEPPDLARSAFGALAAGAAKAASERARATASATLTATDAPASSLCSMNGNGGPDDPLFLTCIPAMLLPAPHADSGIERTEESLDNVMYRRICADDKVWNAVSSAGPSEHAFFCADNF